MTFAGQRHSSYSASLVRRIGGASVVHLRTLPRLQALSWVSRWLKGRPPAQTGAESIQAPSYEGVLNGLNFWDRASGFAGERQVQLSDGGSAVLRSFRSTCGGKW